MHYSRRTTRRTPIAIYHQHRWYLAGPFAMFFSRHQPMHQVGLQQPIDPPHMARCMVSKGGRYASQDAALYRSPRHVYATNCTSIARRQSIPEKLTWFTPYEMGQIVSRCGAGQLRPILGEGRWFQASIITSDYWRSPVPLAPVVRYSLATRAVLPPTSSTSPKLTTSLTQLEQQQKDGLSTPTKRPPPPSVQPTDAVFVQVPDWIGEGPTDAAPPSSSTPPATPAEIPPPVPAESPASVRPRRQPKPCPHYVPETGKWQER